MDKKVSHILFRSGDVAPTYVLEDGTELVPGYYYKYISWRTKDEWDKLVSKEKDEAKAKKWYHL